MPLENRNLEPGTKLVARYKKQDHRCEVVAGEKGKILYRLADGREFTSPSAAGSGVMGGVACNGWRFWSLEGELAEAEAEKPKREAKGKAARKARAGAKAKEGENRSAPVACGECGQEFPTSREAAEHMAEAHGAPEAAGSGAR